MYRLHPWIQNELDKKEPQLKELGLSYLSANPHPTAIQLIEDFLEQSKQLYQKPESSLLIRQVLHTMEDYIDWIALSSNPSAIHLLRKYPHKINWPNLCLNPNGIELLMENEDHIHWKSLCRNPNARPLFDKYPFRIHWDIISMNSGKDIFPLLEEHIDRLSFSFLCKNTHPHVGRLIEKYLARYPKPIEDFSWYQISQNPRLINMLEQYPEHVHWMGLCQNPHPSVLERIKKNVENVVWRNLFKNTNEEVIRWLEENWKNKSRDEWYGFYGNLLKNPVAIELIEKKKDEFHRLDMIAENPGIFCYDYEAMYQRNAPLKEELMSVMFHPKNYDKFITWGFDEFSSD